MRHILCFMPTPEEIIDAIGENADYDVVGDCSKAGAYLTALRQYGTLPDAITHGQESIGFSRTGLQSEIASVQNWRSRHCASAADASDGTGGAIHFDLTGYRR